MTKILLAEDDNEILDDIKIFLEKEGFEVCACSDGLEALNNIRTFDPELIISDVMMPKINGYELFEQLNLSSHKPIPFIFLTAKVDLQSIRRGMSLGADDYLTKPFNFQDLLNAVTLRLKKEKIVREKIENMRLQVSRYIPHELRTPLVSILGFSEIIMEESNKLSKNEIIKMVEMIDYSGKRLFGTIEKFLKLTELETFLLNKTNGESSANIEEELFKFILSRHHYLKNHFHRINFSIEASLLKIPSYYLETALIELVENAAKFSSLNSKISVNGKIGNGNYELTVSDNGIGMTQEQIKMIDVFQQFERSKREQQGDGLGLALVKKILNVFGGYFDIKSTVNKNTSVKLTIPLLNRYNDLMSIDTKT